MSDETFAHDQELKTLPAYFEDIYEGRKTFEVRARDEREFFAGERLLLREWTGTRYSGRAFVIKVTYCCPLDQCGLPGIDGMSVDRRSPLALAWGAER